MKDQLHASNDAEMLGLCFARSRVSSEPPPHEGSQKSEVCV